MALLKSLTHRPFALLWSGQTISRLGDSLYRIALAWWVLEETGSAAVMGTVLIFALIPMLLFLLVGGIAVDRFARLRVMLLSDLLRGTVVAVVALLAFGQALEIWHVYAASALFGFVDAFFQPAYTAMVPEITPREFLPSANSLTSLSRQMANVVGPAVGASIVSLGGTSVAFALDGFSFFVSAACLLPLLTLSMPPVTAPQSSGVIRDLREGIGTVLASPWLWITITIAALGNITLSGPFSVGLPFLVKDHLHADVGMLGLLNSMLSLGSVIGAVWLGRSARIRRRGLKAYSAWMMGGLMILALGLPISTIGVSLAALIGGASLAVFDLIWMNTLQELVPQEMLGRVSSIDYLGSYMLLPVGYAMAGWAIDQIGVATVFVIGGALTAGLAGLGLVHPSIRELN